MDEGTRVSRVRRRCGRVRDFRPGVTSVINRVTLDVFVIYHYLNEMF